MPLLESGITEVIFGDPMHLTVKAGGERREHKGWGRGKDVRSRKVGGVIAGGNA